jgi:hypothetical protein
MISTVSFSRFALAALNLSLKRPLDPVFPTDHPLMHVYESQSANRGMKGQGKSQVSVIIRDNVFIMFSLPKGL